MKASRFTAAHQSMTFSRRMMLVGGALYLGWIGGSLVRGASALGEVGASRSRPAAASFDAGLGLLAKDPG